MKNRLTIIKIQAPHLQNMITDPTYHVRDECKKFANCCYVKSASFAKHLSNFLLISAADVEARIGERDVSY